MNLKKLFPIALLTVLLIGCLNPLGFDPSTLPTISIDASGSEIGIDNINNAELRFVNHTKSMDIINIEMLIDGEAKAGHYYSYGDSRISGGPQSGTSEAILQRPTGENATKSIVVNGYKIVIEYKKNHTYDSMVSNAEIPTNNWGPGEGTIIKVIGTYNRSDGTSWVTPSTGQQIALNLLRGKQLLHFYRDNNGELQVSTSDPDADEHDNYDFIDSSVIISNSTDLNLDNVEITINPLSPVQVNATIEGFSDFSAELKTQIADLHIALSDVKSVLDKINDSIITLGDYINDGNLLLIKLAEGIASNNTFKEKYGSLSIYNGLSKKIDSVYFIKPGENIKYFEVTDISSQSIKGPSLNNAYDNIFVAAGNYNIGIIADGYETYLGEYKIESFIANPSTRLNIKGSGSPEPNYIILSPNNSNLITYTLTSNGGPPANVYEDEYTTTEIIVTFSHDVASFTHNLSVGGTPYISNNGDQKTWIIPVTATQSASYNVQLIGANVDNSNHTVAIYKKDNNAPQFIPVTDVMITNNERFTKDTGKTLGWDVIPGNATNKSAIWTVGEMDGNLILANLLGQTPPYELYGGQYKHTTVTGSFLVRSSWNYDYWYIAVIVPNGKAPGTRNETLNDMSGGGIDLNGTTWSITLQYLRYDKDKDFVKVFRLVAPDVPNPQPPNTAPSTFDLKINFIAPSSDTLVGIALRPVTRNITFNGRTGIQWAMETDSWTYETYFKKHIDESTFYPTFGAEMNKGETRTFTIDKTVSGGYDLFFIEGDGRVRGYSSTTEVDPTKDKNMLFYIPGTENSVEVNYSSEDNQAARIN